MNPTSAVEATRRAFYAINLVTWPIVIVTYLLGAIALVLAVKKTKYSNRTISGILAFLWLWAGIVTNMVFFAWMFGQTLWYYMGLIFIVGSILFLAFGVIRSSLSFKFTGDSYNILGAVMVVYSMLIYPIIGSLTERGYPAYPIFGTFPCPVTIFTFGLLLWADRKVPKIVTVMPLVWALIGVLPVFVYQIWADVGLIILGIVGFVTILRRNAKLPT